MEKSSQHGTQSEQRPGGTPASNHVPRSASVRPAQKNRVPFNQAEAILEALPEGVIACDREGKIVQINAAARKLFEVPSETICRGTDYQQFLQHFEERDEEQSSRSSAQWPMKLVFDEQGESSLPETTYLLLHLPSGRDALVACQCVPLRDAQQHLIETVSVFHEITHRYQKALQFQRVHKAVLELSEAIAHLPKCGDLPWSEAPLSLSPPVVLVAQRLVDVIRHALDCLRVSLFAFQLPAGYMHYVAGTGLTWEQEQHFRKLGELSISPSAVFGETVLVHLHAHQEAVLPVHRLLRQEIRPSGLGPENLLVIPLFLREQLVGILSIVKAGLEGEYSPEEVELVKAVVAQTMLVIEGINCLHTETQAPIRALVLHEVQRLSNDFLTLASHELRTPLTGIMGNLQLAQRRLETLKGQIAHVSEPLTRAQRPLTSAWQSARLQQRMLNDLADDVHIQTNQLMLSFTPCDLLALLKEAVTRRQRDVPERAIVLEVIPTAQVVPILANAERITQVLDTYLTNALSSAPAERPVTVQLTIADAFVRVSVHDEGPDIPLEEQAHLWERFYRAKGNAVQHELDLSLGLGLYLCQAFIERHQGSVGMQSARGKGTTFWFTLPIIPSVGG
jgi:signal transduction histidine kinase